MVRDFLDLRRHGFLSEILSPPVLVLFCGMVIRLHMEHRALVSVRVARIAVIVNNFVLWMAQQSVLYSRYFSLFASVIIRSLVSRFDLIFIYKTSKLILFSQLIYEMGSAA